MWEKRKLSRITPVDPTDFSVPILFVQGKKNSWKLRQTLNTLLQQPTVGVGKW